MSRVGAAVALVAVVACVGLGVALVVGAILVGTGAVLAEHVSPGRARLPLQLPAIAVVLGAELVATALVVGWRVGGRHVREGEGL